MDLLYLVSKLTHQLQRVNSFRTFLSAFFFRFKIVFAYLPSFNLSVQLCPTLKFCNLLFRILNHIKEIEPDFALFCEFLGVYLATFDFLLF